MRPMRIDDAIRTLEVVRTAIESKNSGKINSACGYAFAFVEAIYKFGYFNEPAPDTSPDSLTPHLEQCIRASVNPAYASTPGTESRERAALLGEIDRLRVETSDLRTELDLLGWISVNDELPDLDTWVLAHADGLTLVASLSSLPNHWGRPVWRDSHDEFVELYAMGPVTHWMLLPNYPTPAAEAAV